MVDIQDLRRRYRGLFGLEPTSPGTLAAIEVRLAVALPEDLKAIASFYRGGILGGISHNSFSTGGPENNITDATLRLRSAVGLSSNLVILAEPSESIIILQTSATRDPEPAVVWCNIHALEEVSAGSIPERTDKWKSYRAFFEHLLELEERDRT